jgi:hypothetical protein
MQILRVVFVCTKRFDHDISREVAVETGAAAQITPK